MAPCLPSTGPPAKAPGGAPRRPRYPAVGVPVRVGTGREPACAGQRRTSPRLSAPGIVAANGSVTHLTGPAGPLFERTGSVRDGRGSVGHTRTGGPTRSGSSGCRYSSPDSERAWIRGSRRPPDVPRNTPAARMQSMVAGPGSDSPRPDFAAGRNRRPRIPLRGNGTRIVWHMGVVRTTLTCHPTGGRHGRIVRCRWVSRYRRQRAWISGAAPAGGRSAERAPQGAVHGRVPRSCGRVRPREHPQAYDRRDSPRTMMFDRRFAAI
jgi:hypothetical protein